MIIVLGRKRLPLECVASQSSPIVPDKTRRRRPGAEGDPHFRRPIGHDEIDRRAHTTIRKKYVSARYFLLLVRRLLSVVCLDARSLLSTKASDRDLKTS